MQLYINCIKSLQHYPGVLPKYFSSEWSFAQFHLPEDTHFIAAFGAQNSVIIVGMDGRFGPVLSFFFSLLVYVSEVFLQLKF